MYIHPYGGAIHKYKGSFWWESKLPLVEVDTDAFENERNPAQHPRNARYLCEGFVCAKGNANFLAVRPVLAVRQVHTGSRVPPSYL